MTEQIQLDIPLILPDIPDANDACVGRLTSNLAARPGIGKAHVVPAEGDNPALLCIHYDASLLSLSRIRDIARGAGAALAERSGHVLWSVEGIGHQRKARTVSAQLRVLPGVLEADANAAGMVRVEFDRQQVAESDILGALAKLGVKKKGPEAVPEGDHAGHDHGPGAHKAGDGHDHDHGTFLGANAELIFALACGALLAVGFAIGTDEVLIGKPGMFGTDGIAPLSPALAEAVEQLREGGQTSMVVRQGDRDLGAIGLLDTPRETAKVALKRLHDIGLKRMIMISGDHQRAAEAIAREVGIDEAWGDLMPEDKVEAIKKLRAETKVAMVGDGVNDAPAMATATVGVAMGAAGSDVALETADVALMADDLAHLPFAVDLSRRTRSIIRQNVFVSLGVVALLVPATILGLGIGPAVAMHEGSTLLVVFNALRLLAYRDNPPANGK